MASIEYNSATEDLHPIDIVETLAEHNQWDFDRVADDQIAMAIDGNWRTYSLSLAWAPRDEVLRLICSFEMDPPQDRLAELYESLNLANDRCWCGGFALWPEQKLMVYRYGLTLCGGASAGAEQIDGMVRAAVVACERFYPAFQLVCWGGEAAGSAMRIAMSEAYGHA
ncbi:MAG: YbjN domain-containing protein [Paracoccaceae bacterium]